MLITNFYKIKSITPINDQTIHAAILLNKDHNVFNGHFPGNPVTPGVCMIQAIKEIVQEQLKTKLFLQGISNIKFTALINPEVNADLVLELTIIQDDNSIKIKNITKFVDGVIALKFNGTFIKT